MEINKKYKSYFGIYLSLWFSFIILITFMYITNYSSGIFNILTISFVYLFWSITLNNIENHRFVKYIKKNSPKIWDEKKWISPSQNYFKWREFINSTDTDIDDLSLDEAKDNARKIVLLNKLQFFTIPIITLLVILIKLIIK